jgi:DHA2 family multidrug resistance protein
MHAFNPLTAAGRAALDAMITLQAVIIAYIDDFKLLMILSLVAMPLVLLLRKPATPAAVDHSAVME